MIGLKLYFEVLMPHRPELRDEVNQESQIGLSGANETAKVRVFCVMQAGCW
jgi:hypothetical protein